MMVGAFVLPLETVGMMDGSTTAIGSLAVPILLPTTNTSCRSGVFASGEDREKAPDSANVLVTRPVRCFFHSPMAFGDGAGDGVRGFEG